MSAKKRSDVIGHARVPEGFFVEFQNVNLPKRHTDKPCPNGFNHAKRPLSLQEALDRTQPSGPAFLMSALGH